MSKDDGNAINVPDYTMEFCKINVYFMSSRRQLNLHFFFARLSFKIHGYLDAFTQTVPVNSMFFFSPQYNNECEMLKRSCELGVSVSFLHHGRCEGEEQQERTHGRNLTLLIPSLSSPCTIYVN